MFFAFGAFFMFVYMWNKLWLSFLPEVEGVLISNNLYNKNCFFFYISVAKQRVVEYTQKSQIKHENRHIQLVREYGFHPRQKVTVEDGDVLPRKFEPFPETMYGRPLEEIDTFIYEEVIFLDS